MDRKEFMSLLGLTVGGTVAISCLGGCAKESGVTPGGNTGGSGVNFTLNLNDAGNAVLNNNGGFLIKDGVIVARTTAGAYIAVAAACPHEGTLLQFQGNSQRFYCPNHGSTFSESGNVLNGPASRDLKQYKTELTGTNLRVFS